MSEHAIRWIVGGVVAVAVFVVLLGTLVFGYDKTRTFRWEDGVCYRVTEQSIAGWTYSTTQVNALDVNCGDPES